MEWDLHVSFAEGIHNGESLSALIWNSVEGAVADFLVEIDFGR
jgi:hypothetical protein